MTKPVPILEALVFELLDAAIEDAAVFQDVPDRAPLPVVIIGDILSVPYAGADDPDRRITLTIAVLTEGDERAPCIALQDQVEAALAGTVPRDGWEFHFLLESSAAELADDGSGYAGNTILTILAFSDA